MAVRRLSSAPFRAFVFRGSKWLLAKAPVALGLLILLGLTSSAFGATYTFITFDVDASTTSAFGLNDAGQIVGVFGLGAAAQGYVKDGTTFTTFAVPSATTGTAAFGINDSGQIVGLFGDASGVHGFLKNGTTFTTLDAPGASFTTAEGINNTGQIVGYFLIGSTFHGFVKNGATYTTLDVPGAGSFGTQAFGINGAGQIVGSFSDGSRFHGFLTDGTTFTTLDVPGSISTEAHGINDAGQIVGAFGDSSGVHGFVKDGTTFTTLDVPSPGVILTKAIGINRSGEISGFFQDSSLGGGFLATPVIPVQIEIQPGVPNDPIVLNLPAPVRVTVLGSSTVDVTKIDVTTLRFGPNGASPFFTQIVNTDLLALFHEQDTGIALGDTQACLQGKIAGQPFQGCDDIVVIMAKNCGTGFELAPILPALLWLRGRRRCKAV
jgi:hypothetical protein